MRVASEPVVVQPAEAQVADRTYRFAPSDLSSSVVSGSMVTQDAAELVPAPTLGVEPAQRESRPVRPRADDDSFVKDVDGAPVARDVEPPPRVNSMPPSLVVQRISVPSSASSREAGAGTREAPRFINNRPPAYPETARQRRWQGTVYLRIRLDEAGQVVQVEVARSSGYPVLDAEAANAVRQW